jgi:hypothetical protein
MLAPGACPRRGGTRSWQAGFAGKASANEAFLKGVATGDLGTSLRTNQPVASAIAVRVLGFNFVGDGLRDLCDPKQQPQG